MSGDGKVRLVLSRRGESFITTEDADRLDLRTRGMLSEIQNVMGARRSRRSLLGFAGLTALSGAMVWTLQLFGQLWLGIGLAGLAFLAVGVKSRYRFWEASLIHTKTRAAAPTFLQRKRDDLWIAIVSGMVGLLGGGVIGYLLRDR